MRNVQNIIKYMQLTNIQVLDFYKGYTHPETQETQIAYNMTLQQLQQVELEMIAFGLQIYNRKWELENLIENVYEEDHDKFNEFFTIDLQEGCVLEEKDSQGNHIPAKQIGIKQALEKGEAWGTITRLEFNPFGN